MNDAGNMFRLNDEVALITGGGTGLGLAMARRMAEAGARVVITGRREAVLREAVEQIGHGSQYLVHDVTQLDEAGRLVEEVTGRAGQPTILVNNAGINLKKHATQTTEAEFDAIMWTNVSGAFALSRAVAPAMGMKVIGRRNPSGGWFQRSSASDPTISPVTRLICGWKASRNSSRAPLGPRSRRRPSRRMRLRWANSISTFLRRCRDRS